MQYGDFVILDRDWSSYTRGSRFLVVEEISCGEIDMADGSKCCPVNLRVMLEGEPVPENHRFCRTIPAEYTVRIPYVNEGDTFTVNQGDRDAWVVATLGEEALYEYEMPAGKTYLRIVNLLTGQWRAVSRAALPKKWQREIER